MSATEAPLPGAIFGRRAAVPVQWLHAAGLGFVIVAGRHAQVDALAWGLIAAQLPLLWLSMRRPAVAFWASTAAELTTYALGHGPNIGIGGVIWCAANYNDALTTKSPGGMGVTSSLVGAPLVMAFLPWALAWRSTAVLSGPARHSSPFIAFVVLFVVQVLRENALQRKALFRSADERATAAEAARDRAVVDERARISRELHDVVAHQMSVVVSQAQGAHAIVDKDPSRARKALETISSTTRDALVEMRRLVAVDRSAAAVSVEVEHPQPGLDPWDYARLAQAAEDSGLQDVRFNLESHGDADISPAVALSAYRLIQEAITNAAKHAPGATLAVHADMEAHRLRVEVVNGPATGPPSEIPGSGMGLAGMADRVTFFGGTLTTGPTPDGGWSVVATFPTLEAPSTSE